MIARARPRPWVAGVLVGHLTLSACMATPLDERIVGTFRGADGAHYTFVRGGAFRAEMTDRSGQRFTAGGVYTVERDTVARTITLAGNQA